ncbi:ECF RNA polymerase sigma factor SigK [Nocardioides sp. ChNu-153]|uniref:ECF RNA polymerase sigma factor SigK n=1 Tax=Nocardioides sp. ChNu-153 TaxID=2779364 RepID=UPI002652B617|nr:ECF RNA polymerase sigma factor SigK [Nocardioides sp. ChNu-153]MDN7121075.1 ECF RNA polymerase sigma factor SigK [Nocardioides sp. ChNu-153]
MTTLRSVPSGDPPEGTGGQTPPAAPAAGAAVPADGDVNTQLGSLLRLSCRGDEQAFAALYDATSARVHGLVLRVVRNPSQAEEVTQEVFLEIWRTASRFDPERGSALSWLMTIAHRKAVDRVRSAEAATRRDTSYHQQSQGVDHDATAEAAHSSIEAQRVRSALGALTAVQHEAVQLAYFGGYTHTEVAAMLDLPVGTAKTRIRDGLIRLRDAMGVGQ